MKDEGPIQLSLFDEKDLVEIMHPDFPGERLVACQNMLLARERARKREELLRVTEKDLEKIRRKVCRKRRPLRGAREIGVVAGKVLGASKAAKHFQYEITEDTFTSDRDLPAVPKMRSALLQALTNSPSPPEGRLTCSLLSGSPKTRDHRRQVPEKTGSSTQFRV